MIDAKVQRQDGQVADRTRKMEHEKTAISGRANDCGHGGTSRAVGGESFRQGHRRRRVIALSVLNVDVENGIFRLGSETPVIIPKSVQGPR